MFHFSQVLRVFTVNFKIRCIVCGVDLCPFPFPTLLLEGGFGIFGLFAAIL